ncbi:thioredoxin domain-containing protein 16 [Eublepharis macularius]|uniref:Thioredoxin domain-containing protein 16 n=1 Tax=Eublepharis macularius TaxID=481883 RepID=A0AA97IWR5_EUBMA|nr:thioredoxin domain-containing protein 16 [Eublepharis macularius]XP_054827038.1 thioredoxin domain-containing protein 16 [Eublepharis macularius]
MSSPQTEGWVLLFSLLLRCMSPASTEEDAFLEPKLQEYFRSSAASKASLVYFRRDASSADVFVEQLENSVEALRDYGISVLKVTCHQGETLGYCREDGSMRKAYLFKGHVLLRELPTDALFSVDAIVANVLFALLFNEVKYVATLEDLQNLEDGLRGQSDLVFAYVQAVGTAEHRVLMEAAFVYGSLLRFALTTEVKLLKSIRDEESEVPASKLFFCHCKMAADPAQPCRRTLMEQPLTTLNVHKFLKLMGEPLVMEIMADPEKVSTAHLQLGLPLIFILTQKETLEADRRTAEFVAWRLLGKAGVVLLSRGTAGLDFLLRYNVAIKTAAEGVPVKYLVLKDTDDILALVENVKQGEPIPEEEEEEEEEKEDGESYEQEIQDDEVVESIIRDRKHELPLQHIQTLTEESFGPALANSGSVVVLFYASWEAVSLVVMQSYVEVAARLEGTPGISLARVDCWDWPHLCSRQNVTQFPTIKTYEKGGRSLTYSGMWGTEEVVRFIKLSRTPGPVRLTTPGEVEEYLTGKAPSPSPGVSILGLFDSSRHDAKEAFLEAGAALNGYVTTAIYSGEDAAVLARKYKVPLPALLLAGPENTKRSFIQISKQSAQDMAELIQHALLDPFPEITVGNLPEYFQLRKPLLILFSRGALSQTEEGEMRLLAREENHEAFLACWLNLKNTPVGRGILKAYFGTPLPPLPLLVWVDPHSGGQVFAFPSGQSITETNVLAWIEKLESGLEVPSTTLSNEDWKPRLPAYDFLSRMAPPLPEFTIYSWQSSNREEEVALSGEKAASEVREDPVEDSKVADLEKELPTGGDLRGTAPRLAAREKQAKRHTEL